MKLINFMAVIICASTFSQAHATVPAWRQYYLQRYALPDIYTKLVDDQGNGYDELYGVRNFREVIPGLVYRGGANNVYDKNGKRSNTNPLPTEGLDNLCMEGFATSYYLYSTNYSKEPHSVKCTPRGSGSGMFDYEQQSVLLHTSAVTTILQQVADTIAGNTSGPIYVHCWNGWHASGFISSLILRQFCGFTGDQAVNYWNKNTDGNDTGSSEYDQIRANIRAYTPDPKLMIDAATQAQICPAP